VYACFCKCKILVEVLFCRSPEQFLIWETVCLVIDCFYQPLQNYTNILLIIFSMCGHVSPHKTCLLGFSMCCVIV
jgi:hypothetical protein